MPKNKNKFSKILDIIIVVILLLVLYFAYQFYQKNNFNQFIRSEINPYTSTFVRDNQEKYLEKTSYKIETPEFNDAMFYQKIQVKKNQSYKVTCMVKTREVIAKEEQSGVGAQIAIEGTTERSVAVRGTQDWTKIELIFNSKGREEVNVGFRLGGYLGVAKGEAWFADFAMEEGMVEKDNNWKFACFIFKNTDVTINQKRVQLTVTESDVKDITNTINLFKKSCRNLSDGKMTADCDIFQINSPLSSLCYDNEFGYYVSAEDVESQIKDTISSGDYDHIFVIVRLRR